MRESINSGQAQLHPLRLAIKKSWRMLIDKKEIKQSWLADQCHVDEGRLSKWLSSHEMDFPPTDQMARLIEAMQQWPGVERWEPLEAWNAYFRCRVTEIHHVVQSLNTLSSLMASVSGKVLAAFIAAMAPDSEGGVSITPREAQMITPDMHHLRRVIDEMDDRISEEEGRTERRHA